MLSNSLHLRARIAPFNAQRDRKRPRHSLEQLERHGEPWMGGIGSRWLVRRSSEPADAGSVQVGHAAALLKPRTRWHTMCSRPI